MEKLEYNMRIWEKKRKGAQFQLIAAVVMFAGLFVGSLSQWLSSDHPDSIPYGTLGILTAILILFFILSISSWTNYSFLYHYFYSQWIGLHSPEQLELVTGTIETIETVRFPYAGAFKCLHIRLQDGRVVRYYMKPHLVMKNDSSPTIRFLTYHMFVFQLF